MNKVCKARKQYALLPMNSQAHLVSSTSSETPQHTYPVCAVVCPAAIFGRRSKRALIASDPYLGAKISVRFQDNPKRRNLLFIPATPIFLVRFSCCSRSSCIMCW